MKFQFKRNKYGKELLIDCEKMSEVPNFTKDTKPFWVEFHEIFIITSGTGVFRLDNEKINFKKGYHVEDWLNAIQQVAGE